MKDVSKRTLNVGIQLILISLTSGGLVYVVGIGLLLYILPVSIVFSVYIVLLEVDDMIAENSTEDVAV